MTIKYKCGHCFKYVKPVPIESDEPGEVVFICKEHGEIGGIELIMEVKGIPKGKMT